MARILFVEDDRVTRHLLTRTLSSRGHEVEACESAEEALRRFEEEFFPIVFLDVQLPGMSGLELTGQLRKHRNGEYTYILVGTGSGQADDLHGILSAGANDYIAKPYDMGLLDIRLTVAEEQIKQISSRWDMEKRLRFLATHDPLTGLLNRSCVGPEVGRAIQESEEGNPSTLLYLDLDNFKMVNDTLGHSSGDRLLVNVARLLRREARERDVLIRFGGDEFVTILKGLSLEEARPIAEEIHEAIEGLAFTEGGRTFRIGASIGMVPVLPNTNVERLVASADTACYAAKSRGKNRIETSTDTGELQRLLTDSYWAGRVREGIEDGSLRLWFQPVVDLDTDQVAFYEVLLRLYDEKSDEPVTAGKFIDASLRAGLGEKLDRFVLRSAVGFMRDHSGLKLSINLTNTLFNSDEFPEFLESLFADAGVRPEDAILELTEREVISNLQIARELLERLAAKGFRFALDDFGTGFCALAYLKHLPVHIVKLDASLIRDLPGNDFNQALVKAVADVSSMLEQRTVAEGVEDPETLNLLRSLGVKYAQGWEIGYPKPMLDGREIKA